MLYNFFSFVLWNKHNILNWHLFSDGSGSKIFDLGRVKFLLLVFGLCLAVENYPLKSQIFCPRVQRNLIGSGQKVPGSASFALPLKSQMSLFILLLYNLTLFDLTFWA